MKKIVALLIVLSGWHTVTAQERSINDRQPLWSEFMSEEGNNWQVQWSEHTGVPKVMYSGLSKSYEGTPESIARQFLTEYRELFSMNDGLTDLEFVRTQTNRGVHHVTFQQTYQGINVEESQYKIHIQETGEVIMANGSYYPSISMSIEPAISKKEAITLVECIFTGSNV